MSKGQHGNKEVKKPKQVPAKPLDPAQATPAVAPSGMSRPKQK